MKRITLTNTAGELVNRYCKSAVRRVLMTPVNVTAAGKNDYALVYSEQAFVSIARDGAGPRTCRYYVTDIAGSTEFAAGEREAAIDRFFELVKERTR